MTKYISKELSNLIKQDSKTIKKRHPSEKNADIQNVLAQFFGWRHFQELQINTTNNNFDDFENLNVYQKNQVCRIKNEYLKKVKDKYRYVDLSILVEESQSIMKDCILSGKTLQELKNRLPEATLLMLENSPPALNILEPIKNDLSQLNIKLTELSDLIITGQKHFEALTKIHNIKTQRNLFSKYVKYADLFESNIENMTINLNKQSVLIDNDTMDLILREHFNAELLEELDFYVQSEKLKIIDLIRNLLKGLSEEARNYDENAFYNLMFESKELHFIEDLNQITKKSSFLTKYLNAIKSEKYDHEHIHGLAFPKILLQNPEAFRPQNNEFPFVDWVNIKKYNIIIEMNESFYNDEVCDFFHKYLLNDNFFSYQKID